MEVLEPNPAPTKNKLKINKNCDVYTICYTGANTTELVKIGQIYDHELDKLYEAYDPVTKKKTYDDEHSYIYIDMTMFIVKTSDIIIQGE